MKAANIWYLINNLHINQSLISSPDMCALLIVLIDSCVWQHSLTQKIVYLDTYTAAQAVFYSIKSLLSNFGVGM